MKKLLRKLFVWLELVPTENVVLRLARLEARVSLLAQNILTIATLHNESVNRPAGIDTEVNASIQP